jgi:NAD(P)-dependent dehydrogenase (short-subunit alcohol dehydrogenase family)
MQSEVIVIIGAGGIGQAIARRQGYGKTVFFADIDDTVLKDAVAALEHASYKVVNQSVDVTSRASSTPLAFRRTWPQRRRCWRSICTASPWCLRNSSA